MLKTQRYISDELTHFVGKCLSNEDDQYNLLVNILKSGWLTHPPHENVNKNSGGLTLSRHLKISENLMYVPEVICFCDIPLDDIAFHAAKYSRVGIAFSKSFLTERGANPVFYISKKSEVKHWPNVDEPYNFLKIHRSELFDTMIDNYQALVKNLMIYFKDLFYQSTEVINSKVIQSKIKDFQHQVFELERFLDFHIFSYLKFFVNSKPDNDPENYYMEREWRLIGNLQFSISDVHRVFLPEHYAENFRKDVPTYCGQLTFF